MDAMFICKPNVTPTVNKDGTRMTIPCSAVVIFDNFNRPVCVYAEIAENTIINTTIKDENFSSVLASLGIKLTKNVKVTTLSDAEIHKEAPINEILTFPRPSIVSNF